MYDYIPQELKQLRQWVTWGKRGNDNKKMPWNPRTGYGAKADDPSTWSDYETALEAVRRGDYEGLGFEFANGIVGIDLDHVIENGNLKAEAIDIVATMNSYTEYSPSKTGLHILCYGTMPGKNNRKHKDHGVIVEMYESGRYFRFSGEIYGQPKNIEKRQAELDAVYSKYLADQEKPQQVTRPQANYLPSDREILSRMFQYNPEAKELYNGDMSHYDNDHSRADLALVSYLWYWTNGDVEKTDALFRNSALMRDKWENRADYRARTIEKAQASVQLRPAYNTYAPQQNTPPEPHKTPQSDIKEADVLEASNLANYLKNGLKNDLQAFRNYKDRKTGFKNFDELSGGLYPGLYVLGAISSLGKTTFIHQVADQIVERDPNEHVLYFSLEQSRLEMLTKSIARKTAQLEGVENAISSIALRCGNIKDWQQGGLAKAYEAYEKVADRVTIVECNFNTDIDFIRETTEQYIKLKGVRPIVIVDYLQIIPARNDRQTDKQKTDDIIRGLKKMQSDNKLVCFVISALNRSNYLAPVDFESFKESGGIEYTADVVLGLQLEVLNDEIFTKANKLIEQRAKVKEAKNETPRRIELVCLKNRYGQSSYSCTFEYYPACDLFVEA